MMGFAKRRKLLDPNYGKLARIDKYKKNIYLTEAELDLVAKVSFSLTTSWENNRTKNQKKFVLLTNEDEGYTDEEINLLKEVLPITHKKDNISAFALPKKYSNLSIEEAFNYLVTVLG